LFGAAETELPSSHGLSVKFKSAGVTIWTYGVVSQVIKSSTISTFIIEKAASSLDSTSSKAPPIRAS